MDSKNCWDRKFNETRKITKKNLQNIEQKNEKERERERIW